MALSHIEQFAEDLHQDVLVRAGSEANPALREEAFTEGVLELLSEHNEADGPELCTYEARGTRAAPAAKVSAWALSGDGATLDLFVTRYFGTGKPEPVAKPDARRHFEMLESFLKRALDGAHTRMEESSDAFEVMRRIYEARESLATVRLFFLTDGVLRALDEPDLSLWEIEVRPVLWDLEKLSRLRVGQRATIELDFVNNYDGAIPCIQKADSIGEYRTYLAFFQAPLLARIYGEHGQRLLERNVRAFLQAKGKVNRGLQKTIRDQPSRFLAYNNGLCCTAASVDAEVDKQGNARIRSVKDFQIVNGGQTTASIYHALKKEKTDVTQVVVQVKLTVISDPSKVSEMVPLISQYANSQNKVNTADFSANGPFHQKLEQLSRSVWAPAASGVDRQTHWYYERARGSYADDRSAQGSPTHRRDWEKQNPPKQKFTKTDLAKYELTWLGLPHLVCLGAEKAFLRHAEMMADEGEPVVDQVFFKHLVAKAKLFRTAEDLFSSLDIQGYRAQSVTYAVAWLATRSDRRIHLDRIWEQQRVGPAVCDALAVLCHAAHGHILGQTGNPGEASKREACWETFREASVPVTDAWRAELAETSFVAPSSDDEALAAEWETVRQRFLLDVRPMGALEAITGKQWIAKRRKDPVSTYASSSWADLRNKGGLGPVKLRALLELLAAAAEGA